MVRDTNNTLKHYAKEIGQYPRLSKEEEIKLARKAKKGDREAINKLVEGNLRLVVFFSKTYSFRGLSTAELVQEGNLGLIRAAELYDYRRKLRFSTFAGFHIKARMGRAIENHSKLVRVPARIQEIYNRYNRKNEQSLLETGEVFKKKNSRKKHKKDWLENPKIADLAFCGLDSVSYKMGKEGISKIELQEAVERFLEFLPKEDVDLLETKFGLKGKPEKTFKELAIEMGVTQQTAINRIDNVVRKIKRRYHGNLFFKEALNE